MHNTPGAGGEPTSSKRGAVFGRALAVALVLAVAAGGIWLVGRAASPGAGSETSELAGPEVRAAQVAPGSAAPVDSPAAGGRAPAGRPDSEPEQQRTGPDVLTEWAEQAAPTVGVPARALIAYGRAELAMRSAQPECRLSWATLAGIGRIESDHGRYGDAVLGADGRPSTPIIGVPLNGTPGVRTITDTDGGRYDGDEVHDRAVGPMQFIPSTWQRYASDGDGDGVGDPQQIDDAALAAARYLCVDRRDMASAQGWWSGIMSYNNSVEYAQKVFGLADAYAKLARDAQGDNR